MRGQLLTKWVLIFILVFTPSFTALAGLEYKKKNVIHDPYEYVLKDLRNYIAIYFAAVDEVRILKKDYLPKRMKKGKQGPQIRFIDLSVERDKALSLDYVLEILPLEKVGENYQVGIICYKVDLTSHQVNLMQTSSLIYTFEKSVHGFLFKDALKPLPKDFK
ncbi:hypothetical protein CLV51_107257 [Chitinophaga niastensis]|uniref:Uncharacterized protein n=1 Tax=Chitinophaga niastensis TaxID=536980 RepID=A0A2P8HCI4_CHINA|nr:hypothetical protein [Chitinophaga niastensis]PSL43945.1 hypothetical protein CLV51_107257 [Chitinophaga niastensis]